MSENENKAPTIAGATLDLARRHPLGTLIAAVLVLFLVLYFVPSAFLTLKYGAEDRKVEKLEKTADKEHTAGENEKEAAGEFETERKAEDLYRQTNLEPARERATNALAAATKRRKELEDRHAKNPPTINPDLDPDTLRRRNCSDLAELHPDKRFAGCQ